MHPEVSTLRIILKHISLVQQNLTKVIRDLLDRKEIHDLSKIEDDEFEGFAHFQRINPDVEYGSEGYKQNLEFIKPYTEKAIELHQSRNSHHPEYYKNVKEMGWLDIIEMVCDWYAASQSYSKKGSFENSLKICKEKYSFPQSSYG